MNKSVFYWKIEVGNDFTARSFYNLQSYAVGQT